MNISWQWLGELLDLSNITPEQLYNKLTLAGFELESIQQNEEKDTILEISTTTNRSDTTSIIGITREISSILQCKIKINQGNNLPFFKQAIQSNNEWEEEYITSIIKKIHIKESPEWLKQRLAIYNIASINNINDIINFIAIKWNYHLQILDINQVSKNLTIEQLKTIDINRTISELTFDFGCNIKKYNHNIDIIVQLPIYPPKMKRKIYETYHYPENIKSLYKSETTTRPNIIEAYSETLSLLTKLCQTQYPNKIVHLSTYYKLDMPIHFNYDKIHKLLGPVQDRCHKLNYSIITPNTTDEIFNNLHFINHNNNNVTYVEVPKYRIKDIEREIDIAEELSRIYGFNQFLDNIPAYKLQGKQKTSKYRLNQIRSICRSIGLHEVIHSSLGEAYNIKIYNPLNIEYNSLRSNLLSKLIQSSTHNIKQTKKSLEMFEIGRVFIQESEQYQERIHLAGIIGGNKIIRNTWDRKPQNISWFQAKGDIEEIFERLNLNITWKNCENNELRSSILKDLKQYFKLKQCALLYSNHQQPIGIFGEIKTAKTNLPTSDSLYGLEIQIESLITPSRYISSKQFQTYTKYPSITRDIKIEVPNNWPMDKILNDLQAIDSHLIKSIELFDVYIKQNIQNKSKSLGFRITYSNSNSTLTTEEVNQVEQKLREISTTK